MEGFMAGSNLQPIVAPCDPLAKAKALSRDPG